MTRERVRRRLAAIWSADAVGYSLRMSADDAGTVAEIRTRRELLRERVAAAGGRVVDAVGDNLLAEFPSAVDAVACAIAAQAVLAARDSALPEARRLPFRIGIHLGEVLVDGDALAGDAVNVAARLCALAEPGGVWISGAVHGQVEGKLERGFEDCGEQALKNIPGPIRAFRVAGTSSPIPPPPPRSGKTSRPALAILPFDNLTGDPAQEYLADGIAEELLTSMATWQVPVVARQSSFAYRGRKVDVRQIGRELGVRYVVEGSLRRAGDRIRLNLQLIDAETGAHVWAERFDRELGDLFAIQDEITRAILSSLGFGLHRAEQARALAREPRAPSAWEAFLRAQWHHNRYTPEDWMESRRLIRECVALDPLFPNAQGGLAVVECTGVINGWAPDPEASLAAGLAAAKLGIELDPNLRDTQNALGLGAFLTGDHARAQAAFERSFELDLANPNGPVPLGWFLLAVGRYDEAIARLERSLELEAASDKRSSGRANLVQAYLGAGRPLDAVRCAQIAAGLQSDAETHTMLAAALGHVGRVDEARRELQLVPTARLREVERRLSRQLQRPLLDLIVGGLRAAGMPE